jgi:RNA polymerase sigma factor (sigma-70 family)
LNWEDKTQLKLALDKLTSRQREVFVMAVVDKLSFREISRRLGVNIRAVHDFYYAAQKNLKKFLE